MEVGDKNEENKKIRQNSGKCEDGGGEGGKLELNSFECKISNKTRNCWGGSVLPSIVGLKGDPLVTLALLATLGLKYV